MFCDHLRSWKVRAESAALLAMLGIIPASASTAAPEAPKSPDGSVKIALVASEPDINTPIGATVDAKGRLLVIESNSHFRPTNYSGAATDRIRILQDGKEPGQAAKFTTFFEGMNFLMNLVAQPDGSVVVCQRNEIFRLTDPQGRGAADKKITLAHLETSEKYPHDGLDGLAVDAQGNVYFGIGENMGAPWTLIGADGKTLHDTKGCGSIFRTDAGGNNLQLVARGLWNPFGLGFDPNGTLWALDNDPDGRPPSRLLQIVPGGDYGYEFRYGRTGLHPLQGWDGELPGTLGMVSGVGEAPVAVRAHDGKLLVSSWRDHQIQQFTLAPHGATYRADMQPLVTGGPDFRPTGMALAPDGTLYVNDWGSGSYQINGKGRVWKMTLAPPTGQAAAAPNEAMKQAESLRKSTDIEELTTALGNDDLFIRQAARYGLSQLPESEKLDPATLKSPEQRLGLLAALLWRGTDLRPYVAAAINDPDVRVREMGVRVVTEQGIAQARPGLEKMLDSPVMSPRLLGMIVAGISQLDGDPAARVNSSKIDGILLGKLNSTQTPDSSKAVLLRMLPAERGVVKLDQLRPLLDSTTPLLQVEAVRSLSESSDPARFPLLAEVATAPKYNEMIRAEAVVGLGNDTGANTPLLMQLAQGDSDTLRQEALRSLRAVSTKLTPKQHKNLEDVARQHPTEADMVERLFGKPPANRPAEIDMPGWSKLVDQRPGDPEAGRRIFFHPSGPGCYRCHIIEGRGRAIGPDLTMIGHSQERSHILESILDPSREIAPLYTMWSITLKSGQRVDGMLLRRDGQENEVYVDATAQETHVMEPDVVDRKMRKESLMPASLVQALTDQELRDLVALLSQKR